MSVSRFKSWLSSPRTSYPNSHRHTTSITLRAHDQELCLERILGRGEWSGVALSCVCVRVCVCGGGGEGGGLMHVCVCVCSHTSVLPPGVFA